MGVVAQLNPPVCWGFAPPPKIRIGYILLQAWRSADLVPWGRVPPAKFGDSGIPEPICEPHWATSIALVDAWVKNPFTHIRIGTNAFVYADCDGRVVNTVGKEEEPCLDFPF